MAVHTESRISGERVTLIGYAKCDSVVVHPTRKAGFNQIHRVVATEVKKFRVGMTGTRWESIAESFDNQFLFLLGRHLASKYSVTFF